MEIQPIATFHSPFPTKFGIPKQSGLVQELQGEVVFEPAFCNVDSLRGMEEFDYIWLIWEFSANKHGANSPVVRPPVLGGNERMGVFATRSPYRPNPLGLSVVKIDRIEWESPRAPIIHVLGADLMDGTPIYDIKPYLPYADAHPEARGGFTDRRSWPRLTVHLSSSMASLFDDDERAALSQTLALDPRPHYHDDPNKVYGMLFDGHDIHFRVDGTDLYVID